MKRYSACVFDFDLTLADSSVGILMCFRHTLAKFGYAVPDDETIRATIGMPLDDALVMLSGIPDNPLRNEMRDEYVLKANDVMTKNTFFYEGVIDALRGLRERGVKVGVCSSKMSFRIRESFEVKAGCMPVDVLIGLEDAPKPKPDPSGLLRCIEKLGADRDKVLYFGDSVIDAQTAQNAGVDFAAVLTGPSPREELEKYPHIAICGGLAAFLVNINAE